MPTKFQFVTILYFFGECSTILNIFGGLICFFLHGDGLVVTLASDIFHNYKNKTFLVNGGENLPAIPAAAGWGESVIVLQGEIL